MTAGGDRIVAQQVELAIGELDNLWILPSVAAKIFSAVFLDDSKTNLSELIESDAALCAQMLSVSAKEGIYLSESNPSIKAVVRKLPAQKVQETLLSIELAEDLQVLRIGTELQGPSKKDLVLHNCAVACAAEFIAEKMEQGPDAQLCYLAGLLHDIGKMAFVKAMPKSFSRIAEEAKSQGVSFSKVEQTHFGLDHTILGQRLGRKWSFPESITLAIWLHHSNPAFTTQNIPNVKIAHVVQTANTIARKCGLGDSGNYESAEVDESTMQLLGLSDEDIKRIISNLPEKVQQKSGLLGLDEPQTPAVFSDVAYLSAVKLAGEKNKLSAEAQRLRKTTGVFEFTKEFLSGIDQRCDLFCLTKHFVHCWQKNFQTGPVCLYLVSSEDGPLVTAAAESLSQTTALYVNRPDDADPIPDSIIHQFDILNPQEHLDWLFKQLSIEFDIRQSKLIPLLSGSRAIGALVFELRYPADIELFRETFQTCASMGAAVLDMSIAGTRQQRYAENFSELLSTPKKELPKKAEPSQKGEPSSLIEALAEMAAGAAHELNNPLSVISGRVQILEQRESDDEKKTTLKQIRDNAEEITRIINDLMSFAEPTEARPAKTSVQLLLDEASQLAAQRMGLEKINMDISIKTGADEVFVDSAQIVSSLANIFANAVESYEDNSGIIEVSADSEPEKDFVTVRIRDEGRGMEPQTLEKAVYPFFSSKTAGRKRGMGLAYAQRLIQLNGGRLDIQSQPGSGTTVTINLPTA